MDTLQEHCTDAQIVHIHPSTADCFSLTWLLKESMLYAICVSFFNSNRLAEKLQGLISVEIIPGEDIYCAVTSVLLSSDIEKNLSLRQPRELLHCLRGKKSISYFITNIISVPHFITALYTREHSALSYHICLPCWLSLHSRMNYLQEHVISTLRFSTWCNPVWRLLQDHVTCLRKEGELKYSSGWK